MLRVRLRRWSKTAAIIAAIVLNFVILAEYNTLLWSQKFPGPLLFVAVALFLVGMWFPEVFSGPWAFRIVGIFMLFIGQSYTIHSFVVMLTQPSLVSIMHGIGVVGTFGVMTVNLINQFNRRDNKVPPPLPKKLAYVAAVVPTYGEPVDILENTVASLVKLEYPSDHLYIFVSDDGHRDEVRRMCERYGVGYNKGAKRDAKAGNLNSAIKHVEQVFPQAEFLLTQDADEIIDSTFLQKVMGYFAEDPKMALVQTPKDAVAPPGDLFGVRDRVFYDITQPGRNATNSAFACGSGVVWRISAVKSIGGYDTWNIVEDLTTSFKLHCAGYKSQYHNEILTIGLAPDDIPGLLKQRGTWATDNWRLFLFLNPMVQPGLTLQQRLQYTELGLFYTVTTFFLPLIMMVPMISLLTGDFAPIEGSALYPWLIISLLYYYVFSQGNIHFMVIMLQYWVAHFWTYMKAFSIAVRSKHKKPSYKVTQKTRQSGYYGLMVWPQLLYLIFGVIAILNALFGLPEANALSKIANILVLSIFMFFVWSIVRASFYGVGLREVIVSLLFLDRIGALFKRILPKRRVRPENAGD